MFKHQEALCDHMSIKVSVLVSAPPPTFTKLLLQPQLLLVLQVLHLLAAVLAVLPAAVLYASAAGGSDPEAGQPAGLSRLQLHGAGQFLPAAVEGLAGIREDQLEDFQLVHRRQNHDGTGAGADSGTGGTGTELVTSDDNK